MISNIKIKPYVLAIFHPEEEYTWDILYAEYYHLVQGFEEAKSIAKEIMDEAKCMVKILDVSEYEARDPCAGGF